MRAREELGPSTLVGTEEKDPLDKPSPSSYYKDKMTLQPNTEKLLQRITRGLWCVPGHIFLKANDYTEALI
jgi:hypothetical protein